MRGGRCDILGWSTTMTRMESPAETIKGENPKRVLGVTVQYANVSVEDLDAMPEPPPPDCLLRDPMHQRQVDKMAACNDCSQNPLNRRKANDRD